MIKRITKNRIKEGIKLCIEKGYWSKDVQDFCYSFSDSDKMLTILTSLFNSNQIKASKHYYLLVEYCKENNLSYLE